MYDFPLPERPKNILRIDGKIIFGLVILFKTEYKREILFLKSEKNNR